MEFKFFRRTLKINDANIEEFKKYGINEYFVDSVLEDYFRILEQKRKRVLKYHPKIPISIIDDFCKYPSMDIHIVYNRYCHLYKNIEDKKFIWKDLQKAARSFLK